MRYDEFRDQLQNALHGAGVLFRCDRPSETIDIEGLSRGWRVYVWRGESRNTDPFGASAKISFDWRALNAARGYTCEEDVLTEMLGRRLRVPKTQRRWVRVDLKLHASLPYGASARIPDPQLLGSWTAAVGEKLDKLLTEVEERRGQIVAVTGGRQNVKIKSQCTAQGELSLTGLSVSAFQLVRLPRVWDDPGRRDFEKSYGKELARLALRFKMALERWLNSGIGSATPLRHLKQSRSNHGSKTKRRKAGQRQFTEIGLIGTRNIVNSPDSEPALNGIRV